MSSRLLTLALILLAASSAIGVARAPPAPPWAMNWSPTGVEVPLDAPIVITWSQPMNASAVEAAFTLTDGVTVWNRSAFQWVHATSAPWTSQASTRSPYPRLTVLTATVNASATDGSGQRLDQNRNGTGGEPAWTVAPWPLTPSFVQPIAESP